MTPMKPPASLYTSSAIFLLGALSLATTSGYFIGLIMLFVGGLYASVRRPSIRLSSQDNALFLCLLFFGLVSLFEASWFQLSSSMYDKALRFVLIIPVYFLLRKYPPKPSWIWAGIIIGCISATGYTTWIRLVLDLDRNSLTSMRNPIFLGNTSLMMGIFCIAGLSWAKELEKKSRRLWFTYLLIGASCGLFASLLSGSRGGWIGLPLVILVLYKAYSDLLQRKHKILLLTLLISVLFTAYKTPQLEVEHRVQQAVHEINAYFSTTSSSTSVGARFAMWEGASKLFIEKPLIGWGKDNYQKRMAELVEEGRANEVVNNFDHAHNDLIDIAAKRGLLGVVALLFLYLVPIKLFSPHLRSSNLKQRSFAIAGLMLVLTYIDFGLSNAFLNRHYGVSIYLVWLMIWWACLRNTTEQPPPNTASAATVL
jgi:O-antigen ligase